MTNDVGNPKFWEGRIQSVEDKSQPLHYAVFHCAENEWKEIENIHRAELKRRIRGSESILDLGCAYGRLLTLMPDRWFGDYLGIDLSPAFINMAKAKHPYRKFQVADLETVTLDKKYTLAVGISLKGMIVREQGQEVWDKIDNNIRSLADEVLYLEYT